MKTEEQENKKNLSSERMKTTFAAFALGVNKILLSWLRHYKKGQEMLRQTLMTTNKNIVHSSGVIILSYKNEFRGKLFFLWVDHEKAHRTTLRTFTQQPPVHPYIVHTYALHREHKEVSFENMTNNNNWSKDIY